MSLQGIGWLCSQAKPRAACSLGPQPLTITHRASHSPVSSQCPSFHPCWCQSSCWRQSHHCAGCSLRKLTPSPSPGGQHASYPCPLTLQSICLLGLP